MSNKIKAIRPSDKVRIINPDIIERWGYPLTTQMVKDTMITQEHKDSIYAMLSKFRGGYPQRTLIPLFGNDGLTVSDYDETYEKVLTVMAYDMVRKQGFGGKDRKLYIKQRESLRNKTAQVLQRKVVKTGKYHPGGGYQDYYSGEYDYEPAYLENEKTHVLYKIYLDWGQDICPEINDSGGVWIEKTNVEKITNNE